MPVFECGRILDWGGSGENRCHVAVPALENAHDIVGQAFGWVLQVINAVLGAEDVQRHLPTLEPLMKELGQLASSASNAPRFLRAAFELGIPTSRIAGKVFQFGQGARARWLDSSFTDETPSIGASLARHKARCAQVLRRAGIPAPAHFKVDDADEAVKAAQRLGYPVVVKPVDLDGGRGVMAGLKSPEAVRGAFAAAREHSRNVLVEKHFTGRDFRLVVFRGELIWAIERIPGGVTGDGETSIAALVERLNAGTGARRSAGAHRHALELDDEARRLLADEGLSPDSVPGAGRFVALRAAANFARGGSIEVVFEDVHPDNRVLAIRAAAALRLDLAGVDLLIQDIRRSWLDTGAAICEVNGQPFLGGAWTFLYERILRRLVAGDGRIPIAVVLGAAPADEIAQRIAAELAAAGRVAGWADREGASVAAARIARGPLNAFAGGQVLMADKGVDAAVLCVNDTEILRSGLPFDRFDALLVAGTRLVDRANRPLEDPAAGLQRLVRTLRPACRGAIFASPGLPEPVAGAQVAGAEESAALVCRELLAQFPAA